MKRSEFYYDLPQNLIAQDPLEQRDHSRLMVLNKETGEIEHRHFYDIVDLLNEGDVLVLNDSKVMPARLYGVKEGTMGKFEMLLLEQKGYNLWEVLVRPGKKAKIGARFVFGNGLLTATVRDIVEEGNRIVEFEYDGNFFDVLDQIGEMPLPHYITHKLEDKDRYQTVYAKELGSSAAPTAGLHFTPELLKKIQEKGVKVEFVTLHVGLGTFRPVKEEEITDHKMHTEHYQMSQKTADAINEAKANGKRVIAVGTTSCRTLESVAQKEGCIRASEGYTDIFIYPGYQFKVLDCLITNFHLPESTLIMLVSALAGYEHTRHAYQVAVQEQDRFYSFGDAMLVV
mgnify:FL=1